MADEPREIVPVADHAFRQATLVEAGHLAQHAPERLTDVHLAHLAHYVSAYELADILQRRDAAEDAATVAAYERDNAAFRAEQATHTGAAQSLTVKSLEGLSFEEICKQYPDVPATLGEIDMICTFVLDMNERNKERNAKIAALEQQLADLKVELDAWVQVRS